MTKDSICLSIRNIISADIDFGITMFGLIKGDETKYIKQFEITMNFKDDLKDRIKEVIQHTFLKEDAEYNSSDNIADNKKIFYEVVQDEKYYPFSFLDENVDGYMTKEEEAKIIGLVFRLNLNDNYIWCYQQIYSMSKIDKAKHLYAIINETFDHKRVYDRFSDDIIRIDNRVDILIVGNSIVTCKIDLLQKQFGFEKYIREGAKETIQAIEKLDIVDGLEKFFAFGEKDKLTNAKKLLKAKNSPVLQMEKITLLKNIQNHPRYSKEFEIKEDKLIIGSQKQAGMFIKMINDDYVRSELTGKEYDSATKQLLEPII